MVRKREEESRSESRVEAIPLSQPRKLQKRYYAGLQLPSPQGGFLEPLRVRPEDDGTASVIFECNTSSLRYSLPIPRATRTERRKVKDMQEAGDDPHCPRHGPETRLARVGKNLVCPLCGVAYARV